MKWILGSFFLLTSYCFAQSYGSSFGVRLGNNKNYRTVGLSLKQRVLQKTTVEAIIQSDFKRNTTGHLLIERHRNIFTRRLNLYAGAGVSLGKEQTEYTTEDGLILRSCCNTTTGVDLIAGVEVNLLGYNLSLDYKPNFNITGREPWYADQVGISLRAVINKGKAQEKRWKEKKKAKRKKEREKRREERGPLFEGFFKKKE